MSFHLRLAAANDLRALSALGTDSFVAAFGHLYKAADLNAFLTENRTVEAYSELLADPGTKIMLADAGGSLAGYCLIHAPSEFAPESDASRPMALHHLYTAPGMTGRGIGAALMEWALGEARALGCDAVQLSVWSGNLAAQRFYARYGFAKIADIGFMVGNHRDEEFLFELRL